MMSQVLNLLDGIDTECDCIAFTGIGLLIYLMTQLVVSHNTVCYPCSCTTTYMEGLACNT